MEEYEKVLGYLGYSADQVILEAIKSEVRFKVPDVLDVREFLKAMRVYRTMEVSKFKELFTKYDEDGSGGLSIDELDPLIREIGYIPTVNMLKELCRMFQGQEMPDSELEVHRDHFVKFMRTFQGNEGFTQKEAQMFKDGFAQLDHGRGELSTVQLAGFLRWCGYSCKAVEVQALCESIDVEESGYFDFAEAMKIFRMRRNYELSKAEMLLDPEEHSLFLVELSDLITEFGYEATFKRIKLFANAKDEEDTVKLTWFEVQQVFDKVRKDEQVCQRERAGFSKKATDLYMRGFNTYAKAKKTAHEDLYQLEVGDVVKMMKHIGTYPAYQVEREVLEETIADSIAHNHPPMNFQQFLRLLMSFYDEVALVVRRREQHLAKQCCFDDNEVEMFRAIYNKKASDPAAHVFTLNDLIALLITLGIGGLNNPQSGLKKQLAEIFNDSDLDKSGSQDFLEFMLCMKNLVESDFGNLSKLTGIVVTTIPPPKNGRPSIRMSLADALTSRMRDEKRA
jgi:Ca2+-binding EF-hand superfamily protein